MKNKPGSFARYLLSVTPDPGWRVSYAWLFFLMTLAVAALLTNRLNPEAFVVLRLWSAERVLPVMRVISLPFRSAETFVDDAILLLRADQEIERLKEQIAVLQLQQESLPSIVSENRLLREQLNLIDKPLFPLSATVTAKVRIDQSGYFRHSIIASAGEADGVKINAPVISKGNLIGKVTHVSDNLSQILLLYDLNSQIPVMIMPSRKRAILSGNNSQILNLKYLQNTLDLEPGMLVTTSGDEGAIPPGIVAGNISYIDHDNNIAYVRPRVAITQQEYLQILIEPDATD